jgi:hypothetical protein
LFIPWWWHYIIHRTHIAKQSLFANIVQCQIGQQLRNIKLKCLPTFNKVIDYTFICNSGIAIHWSEKKQVDQIKRKKDKIVSESAEVNRHQRVRIRVPPCHWFPKCTQRLFLNFQIRSKQSWQFSSTASTMLYLLPSGAGNEFIFSDQIYKNNTKTIALWILPLIPQSTKCKSGIWHRSKLQMA